MIGLGYVCLPLVAAFAENHLVIGFDTNKTRVDELGSGNDGALEVDRDLLASVQSSISYASSIQDVKDCNIFIVNERL